MLIRIESVFRTYKRKMWILFNRYSMVSLSVGRHCDSCDTCRVSCPMDLNVSVDFNSGDCIRCLECVQCKALSIETVFQKRETTAGESSEPLGES